MVLLSGSVSLSWLNLCFARFAARTSNDAYTQLLLAAQLGAARELFEETGMDMRNQLHRLEPAGLRSEITTDFEGRFVLTCELNKRLYFVLTVTDGDFFNAVSAWE